MTETHPAQGALPERTVVVVVGRDVQAQLPGVLAAIPEAHRDAVVVVDDGSAPPLDAGGLRVIRHPEGRGYGAAQKTGYSEAFRMGAERVVLLHGDGQYPVAEVLALAHALDEADVALGSRFLDDGGRAIPGWRRAGNRLLTGLANLRFGTRLSELHTGARAYRAGFLFTLDLDAMSDDYLFDQQVLVAALRQGRRFAERPLTARYDATVQSIRPLPALRYGLGCVAQILLG